MWNLAFRTTFFYAFWAQNWNYIHNYYTHLFFYFYSCQKDAIRNGKQIKAGLTVLTHIAYNKHPLDFLPALSEVFTNKNFMAHDFTKVIRFVAYLYTFVHVLPLQCNCDLIFRALLDQILVDQTLIFAILNTKTVYPVFLHTFNLHLKFVWFFIWYSLVARIKDSCIVWEFYDDQFTFSWFLSCSPGTEDRSQNTANECFIRQIQLMKCH